MTGFLALLLLAQTVNAHPGNTAADGCHYCRTNCDKWGESWGERHCHGGYSDYGGYDSYSPPKPKDYCSVQGLYEAYIMKKSQGEEMTSLGEKSWWYLCPLENRRAVLKKIETQYSGYACNDNQMFDANSHQCKCKDGFDLIKGKCITMDAVCAIALKGSFYNKNRDECRCPRGQTVSKTGKECINGNQYCYDSFPHSHWVDHKYSCICDKGWQMNNQKNGCIQLSSSVSLKAQR